MSREGEEVAVQLLHVHPKMRHRLRCIHDYLRADSVRRINN